MSAAGSIGCTEEDARARVEAAGGQCRIVRLQNAKQDRADTFLVVRERSVDGVTELVTTPFIIGAKHA